MYSAILLSHEKEWMNAFAATLMDLEIIIPNEVGQRKANICCHLYVESEKVIQKNLLIKQTGSQT